MHLPKTLARFGTRRAAECLLVSVETEADRLVRYKSIRALGLLVAERGIPVDRRRVERLSHQNLVEHFHFLGLRAALDDGGVPSASPPRFSTERLLVGLLDDKLRQSLERAFRLLKVAHPREDIHRAFVAFVSGDAYLKANAVEFLDTLLPRRDEQDIRELLRVAADDLPLVERAGRIRHLIASPAPTTIDEALAVLMHDADPTMSTLAIAHAAVVGGPGVRSLAEELASRTVRQGAGPDRSSASSPAVPEPVHA
jgi:hypothetical protein